MLDKLLSWLQTAFETALVPFRAVMVMLGFAPSDMQVWTFMVGLFLLALVLPEAYSSYVLRRRRMRTTGTVVHIDTSGESPYSPTIRFKDRVGREWSFDSGLPCNTRTERVGASVPVIYDPLNPKRAREEGRIAMKTFTTIAWWGFIAGTFAFAFNVIGN